MSKLLLDEQPLVILPKLAAVIGLNEAIVLQQLHYWLERSKNVRDGFVWVYNTYADWVEQFPFWSESTIRRTIGKLEKERIIIVGKYNKLKIDNTKWYRIDYEQLEQIEKLTKTKKTPSGQNEQTCVQNEQTNCSEWTDQLPKMNRPLPETTTENTTNKKEEDDSPHLPPQNNSLYDQVYAKVVRIYQENIGILPPIYAELFGELLTTMGEELVIEAIKRAAGQNVRKWAYIEKMLVDWKNNQCLTLADVKALDDQQKGGGKNATHRSGYGSYSPASRSYAEEDANRRRSMPSFIKRV